MKDTVIKGGKLHYLEEETKETISGYHLVPWALVPRAEVTPMPGVRGEAGGCLRKGESGLTQAVCAAEGILSLGGGRPKSSIQVSA